MFDFITKNIPLFSTPSAVMLQFTLPDHSCVDLNISRRRSSYRSLSSTKRNDSIRWQHISRFGMLGFTVLKIEISLLLRRVSRIQNVKSKGWDILSFKNFRNAGIAAPQQKPPIPSSFVKCHNTHFLVTDNIAKKTRWPSFLETAYRYALRNTNIEMNGQFFA